MEKGLVQAKGSGVTLKSAATFDGQATFNGVLAAGNGLNIAGGVSTIDTTDFPVSARLELSASDSGKTFVCGDDDADYTIHIPAVLGWKARFTVTGSGTTGAVLANDVFLSASADFGIAAARNPFRGQVIADGGGGDSGDIIGGTDNNGDVGMVKIIGGAGGVDGGDYVDVEVTSTTAATATIVITGMTNG